MHDKDGIQATPALLVETAEDRCVGAGQCELVAPELFAQDDDGVSRVRIAEPEPELWPAAREAADLCPVQAVLLTGTAATDTAATGEAATGTAAGAGGAERERRGG